MVNSLRSLKHKNKALKAETKANHTAVETKIERVFNEVLQNATQTSRALLSVGDDVNNKN